MLGSKSYDLAFYVRKFTDSRQVGPTGKLLISDIHTENSGGAEEVPYQGKEAGG